MPAQPRDNDSEWRHGAGEEDQRNREGLRERGGETRKREKEKWRERQFEQRFSVYGQRTTGGVLYCVLYKLCGRTK